MAKIPDMNFTWDYFELDPEPVGASKQELRELLLECICMLERAEHHNSRELIRKARKALEKGRTT